MANTFTNLVANTYKAFDVVSRELTGAINSVTLDAAASAIPVGQTLYSFQTPSATAGTTVTPAVTPPDDGDQTIASKTLTISTSRREPFRWSGEEAMAVERGAGINAVMQGQIEQAIRSIVNRMETAILLAAQLGASRAYGTAGTTAFASDLSAASNLRKILDDNGAPMGARSLIIDTTAGVNLRNLSQLTKVNEAGSQMALRDGELLDLFGLSVKESAGVPSVTKGAMTGALINNAAAAIGDTTITFDTGTVNTTGIKAGDVITIGTDTNKYVVTTGTTSTSGTFTIAAPGLRTAVADNSAITVLNSYTGNVAFSQNAIVFAARTPYFGNDLARNQEIITDPRTGISLRLAEYPNYARTQYEVSAAWGVTVVKPEHCAILLG